MDEEADAAADPKQVEEVLEAEVGVLVWLPICSSQQSAQAASKLLRASAGLCHEGFV